MKRKVVFYYDETFHDRRLNSKDGVLNAYLDTSHDGFVFGLLGADEETLNGFLKEYTDLEMVIKRKLKTDKELKSTTFNNKNFVYGISSLKKDCKQFYFAFFDLLIKHNLLFQVGYISKTELLVQRYFACLNIPFNFPYKSFVYSFTKLLENHRLEYLFDELLENNKNNIKVFTKKVIELLETLLKKIQGIKREEIEIIVIQKIIMFLKIVRFKNSYQIRSEWNYGIVAEGIKNRINETDCECTIFVDNEETTYRALIAAGIDSYQQDSKTSIGIRAVDMFVGFVGRIIKALRNARKEPSLKSINDIKRELYENKRIVPNEWFDLDEKEFNLAKRIAKYFSSATYWSSFVMCYPDDIMMFFSFFNYVNFYESYDLYKKDKGKHNEYYNTYLCQQINDLYSDEV